MVIYCVVEIGGICLKKMKINFVLPGFQPKKPIGGYKIVFEYANALSASGNEVHITFLGQPIFEKVSKKSLYNIIRFLYRKFIKFFCRRVKWFDLNANIKLHIEKSDLLNNYVDADAVIATSSLTAHVVNRLPETKGVKFHFIQADERSFNVDNQTEVAWSYPTIKITVSSFLKGIVHEATGQHVYYVSNFVDQKEFFLIKPISERRHVISMLVHEQENKGTRYGLQALSRVAEKIPDVEILLFGVADKPSDLHFKFSYIQSATHDQLLEIYNRSAVYLMPAYNEGWGLTATEAMMCGAALVTAKNGGTDDFAIDEVTAKVVEPKSAEALSKAAIHLLDADAERVSLAQSGKEKIGSFTREQSTSQFDRIIQKYLR